MIVNSLVICWLFLTFEFFLNIANCTKCDLTRKSINSTQLKDALKHCGNVSAVEELDLTENIIDVLQMEYFLNFTNLRYLLVDSNRLKQVPNDVNRYVSKLQTLSLMHNYIKDISGISSSSLTTLDITSNQISVIPAFAFVSMPSLQQLHLSLNKISRISRKSFKGLSRLKRLYLDGNQLDILYTGTFNDLKQLEVFSAAHNKLERVRNGVFSNFPQLKEIFLNDNKLNILDEGSFQGLTLHRADLQNNDVKRFKGSVFGNSKVYGKINMRFNPLYCDCWLLEPILTALREKGEIQGSCSAPKALTGKNILPLTHSELVCKKVDSCDKNLCLNNSVCKHVNETFYECECQGGYRGDRCELAVNEDNTVMIILCVCLGAVLIAALIIVGVVYVRKKRNAMNRCISKEVCCCFMILSVFFFLFALFVGLRVACKFHEYC